MSDYRRVLVPGASYFFTVVTYKRIPVFTSEQNVEKLRQSFRAIMIRKPFHIEAMVVLPDHLHCIWRLPDEDADYSGRWREIKKNFTKKMQADFCGKIWQKRFWEHFIRDDYDWRKHMDYIHYNPVKHGLVNNPAEWKWSTFHNAVEKGWYDPLWGRTEPPGLADLKWE